MLAQTIRKILLVSPVFAHTLGYQEVYVARTLHDMGYELSVLCSTLVPLGYRASSKDFDTSIFPFPVQRFPARFRFRSTIFVDSRALVDAAIRYQPDLIIIFNVRAGFPLPIIRSEVLRKVPVVTFFSDASEYRRAERGKDKLTSLLQEIGVRVLGKNSWYREAIARSHVVVCNLPETQKILQQLVRPEFHNRLVQKPLGVNSEIFFFSEEIRAKTRREKAVTKDTLVLITATKVQPSKGIEKLIGKVGEFIQNFDKNVQYWIVGSLKDSYEAELETLIKRKGLEKYIHLFPMVEGQELNRLYNAADVGLWYFATHAIQEAMATGLPVVLPYRASLTHLIRRDKQGVYYRDLQRLQDVQWEQICGLALDVKEREKIAAENQEFLDYRCILQDIIDRVKAIEQFRKSNGEG